MTKQTHPGNLEVRFGGKTVGLYSVPEDQKPSAKNRMIQLERSGGADKNVDFVRTLAAAPELLEALETASKMLFHIGSGQIQPTQEDFFEIHDRTRAAIAKARGLEHMPQEDVRDCPHFDMGVGR